MRYSIDREYDIVHMRFNENNYSYSVEIGNNIVADIDVKGNVCGMEIFDVSKLKEFTLEKE